MMIESFPFGDNYILLVSDRQFLIRHKDMPDINVIVVRQSMKQLFEVMCRIMTMPESSEPFCGEKQEIIHPQKMTYRLVVNFKNAMGRISADLESEDCLLLTPVKNSEQQPAQRVRKYRKKNNKVHFHEQNDISEFCIAARLLLPYLCNSNLTNLFGLFNLINEVVLLEPEQIQAFFVSGRQQQNWLVKRMNEKIFPEADFNNAEELKRKRKKFIIFIHMHFDVIKMSVFVKQKIEEFSSSIV